MHTAVIPMQAADTAELIEKLEDSQMTLGSMATNRYSAPFREEVQVRRVTPVVPPPWPSVVLG
jgi:hypothetical protein